MKLKYAVYQINTERDANRLLFLNYERTMRDVGKIDMEIYDKVYEGEIQEDEICGEFTLERIYFQLNIHRDQHPNCKGHSLSVSDIVEINGMRWFCDSVGWRRLES